MKSSSVTYTKFSDYNVHHTAHDNQGIKRVPGIHEVVLQITGHTDREKTKRKKNVYKDCPTI